MTASREQRSAGPGQRFTAAWTSRSCDGATPARAGFRRSSNRNAPAVSARRSDRGYGRPAEPRHVLDEPLGPDRVRLRAGGHRPTTAHGRSLPRRSRRRGTGSGAGAAGDPVHDGEARHRRIGQENGDRPGYGRLARRRPSPGRIRLPEPPPSGEDDRQRRRCKGYVAGTAQGLKREQDSSRQRQQGERQRATRRVRVHGPTTPDDHRAA